MPLFFARLAVAADAKEAVGIAEARRPLHLAEGEGRRKAEEDDVDGALATAAEDEKRGAAFRDARPPPWSSMVFFRVDARAAASAASVLARSMQKETEKEERGRRERE